MKKTLLQILACPNCEGEIELQPGVTLLNNEVMSGRLQCVNCGMEFPIQQGVPCLLPLQGRNSQTEGFTQQWNYRFSGRFENKYLYGLNPVHRIEDINAKFVYPIQENEWVLDAGCGSAEMTFAAAKLYPQAQFVGLELSEAIQLAARNAGSLANIHFVQGNVMNPPFKKGVFLKAYSMGVLHHTPDTKAAFKSVASLVSPYGNLVIWLYPDPIECPANIPYYGIRDFVFMGMGHKIPAELRFWLIQFYSATLLPVIIIAEFLRKELYNLFKNNDWFSPENNSLTEIYQATSFLENLNWLEMYQTISFWIFDDITPEFQFRHKREEVLQWFAENHFDEADADTIGTYWGKRWG